jgi:O-antigen ligase
MKVRILQIEENAKIILRNQKWFDRVMIFAIVPAAIVFVLLLTRGRALWLWLTTVAIYATLLSVVGISNRTNEDKPRNRVKQIVRIMGMIVWSGFIAMFYFFVYLVIFHRDFFGAE